MKKNIIITILATALISITLLIIVGLIANGQEKEKAPVTTSNYMTEFKNEFMKGCVSEKANYSSCSCLYEDLLNKLGENGLIKMAVKYADDEIVPDELVNSAKQCAYLNK